MRAQPGVCAGTWASSVPAAPRASLPCASLEARFLLQLRYFALSLSPGHPTRLLCLPRPHSSIIPRHSGGPLSWLRLHCEGASLSRKRNLSEKTSVFVFTQGRLPHYIAQLWFSSILCDYIEKNSLIYSPNHSLILVLNIPVTYK